MSTTPMRPPRAVTPRPRGWYGIFKRVVDLAVAAVLLVLLSPVLLLTAAAIRLDSPGPALFRQRRAGRGSGEFTIYKFRTMKTGTPDLASHLIGTGHDRYTSIGPFLRRTSLDELPQLLNVLRGDMALVGPRPALHNQDDLIALRQQEGVDALRPGVTGWAQVNGRDELPVPAKVRFDRHYLDHCSPWLDFVILLRTVAVLFTGRGTN
jgi:O-antigen biosynthesis protein WbqP